MSEIGNDGERDAEDGTGTGGVTDTSDVKSTGGTDVRDGRSSGEDGSVFGSAGERRSTWLVLGVWAVIGVGMGLTPVAIGLVAPNASVGTWSTSLGLLTSAGPIVGGVLGLFLAIAVPLEPIRGAVVSLGANGVGFALFVLVFVAILMLAAGASVAVSVETLLGATLVAAVPVAITAGGATGIALAVLESSDGRIDRR